jgi:hypothetical protein
MGTTFLIGLVNRFDGRAEDALAAYNAGPTRLQRWRRTPEYGDRDVFMEHIPFRETRNYVKLVQQYARIYTALYGCEGFEPCLGLSYAEAGAFGDVHFVCVNTPQKQGEHACDMSYVDAAMTSLARSA